MHMGGCFLSSYQPHREAGDVRAFSSDATVINRHDSSPLSGRGAARRRNAARDAFMAETISRRVATYAAEAASCARCPLADNRTDFYASRWRRPCRALPLRAGPV